MKSDMDSLRESGQMSAPTRGPWIEITVSLTAMSTRDVGPHTGAVD